MCKNALVLGILTAAAVALASCSSRPNYNEDLPKQVDEYFNKMQDEVQITDTLPVDSMFKDYVGTELNLTDNRDVKHRYPHTPFVTKYDPDTKVNIGPGHVPGKTKWEPIIEAEVSNSETEPWRQWKIGEFPLKDAPFAYLRYKSGEGEFVNTRWSYMASREVGPNHVFWKGQSKTKFSFKAKREVDPELYDAEFTRWSPVYEQEVGLGFDPDFTTYCPTCQRDVGNFGHRQEGDIHYGHVCGLTLYSPVWGVDMFRKEAKIYEKVPSSKHDYTELDKAYAPDHQPRLYEPPVPKEDQTENTLHDVPWVEDRKVLLDRDALSKVDWKWKNPTAKKLTFELAQRRISDVAKEVMDMVKNARDPRYKWVKEKEKDK